MVAAITFILIAMCFYQGLQAHDSESSPTFTRCRNWADCEQTGGCCVRERFRISPVDPVCNVVTTDFVGCCEPLPRIGDFCLSNVRSQEGAFFYACPCVDGDLCDPDGPLLLIGGQSGHCARNCVTSKDCEGNQCCLNGRCNYLGKEASDCNPEYNGLKSKDWTLFEDSCPCGKKFICGSESMCEKKTSAKKQKSAKEQKIAKKQKMAKKQIVSFKKKASKKEKR